MNNEFLEQYFEQVILPQYKNLTFTNVTWKDHGKVGLDTWAHYFEDTAGIEYVLLYEDYPTGEYLNDDLSHEVIPCGSDTSLHVSLSSAAVIDNVSGYFTLYKEKR